MLIIPNLFGSFLTLETYHKLKMEVYMKSKNKDSISQNIKKYRLLNHMTQGNLAEQLSLDTQYYAQLERGERNFTIDKLTRLCSIFQIGIEDIIEIEKPEQQDTSEVREEINKKLDTLSCTQLRTVEKFITEIIPYVK